MSGIKQPVTQVRLTNVAVVRYKTKGHRYEIACYKNKVVSWRQGVEQDIDEVLQSRHIFANVSKGVLAADEQLLADFGTREEQHIAKVILDKGEIQVSEKERAAALDALFRDISVLVSDMCVNPDTRRPYPVRMVEQGMRDAHYSIKQHKSAKSQALTVIKLLQQHMPLDRAHMRVVITCEIAAGKEMKRRLQPLIERVEEEEWGSVEYRVKVLLSPGNYRQVEELIAQQNKGRAHCEIVDLKVQEDAIGDEDDDDEDGDSDGDDDDQPQPMPVIHQPAPRPSTAAITSQLAATHLTQPHSQQQAQTTAARSKKAMRKVLDEEEIRTVGERREWEEEVGDVEDSSAVRQKQQQANRKAKKERKNKNKGAKGHDDEEDEDEVGKGKSKGKKAALDEDSEEAEEDADGVNKTGKKALAAVEAAGNGDDDDDGGGRTKKEKKSRRKKKEKTVVVGTVTSLQSHSNDDDED